MIRTCAAIAAAAAFVTCAAACGGGAPPTVAVTGLVTRVNAVCTSYAEHMEALAVPSFTSGSVTAANLRTVARYLDKAVPLLQLEQSSIEAVGTPRSDGGLYHSMLAALAAHVRDEQTAREAAHSGDLRSFRAALHADQTDSTRLSGTAQQLGVAACIGG